MTFPITLDHTRRRQEATLALTQQLIEIESPSGDIAGSRAVVEKLKAVAAEIATVSAIEEIVNHDYGIHLLIRFFASETENKQTLLLGHTDTVYTCGTLAARPVRLEGERLYGPGAFDMKANCAVALEALRVLSELGVRPRRPITLLLTCDEETGSFSGRELVERETRNAAHVLVLEPSAPGGDVKTARKGTGVWQITAHGVAAHAGLNPQAGASAVRELAAQIKRLYDLEDFERGTTVNVGTVHGGTRANVVAESAAAELDVRFSTLDEARRIEDAVNKLIALDPRVRLQIEGGINRPPLERTKGTVELYHQAREIAARLGLQLGEQAVGGASDGNFAAALGVPVLDGLGVQGDGAHAAHEHILMSDVPFRTALLANLIATL